MPKQICMLAHPYDLKRVIFPAYIQPKLDGIRAIFLYKEKRFISQNNKPLIEIHSSIYDSHYNRIGTIDSH